MPRFTKRFLDSLEPAKTARILWDDSLRGFCVRVNPSGAVKFLVKWTRNGKARQHQLGTYGLITLDQARDRARAALDAVECGEHPGSAGAADLTVAALLDRYLNAPTVQLKPKSKDAYASAFRRHVVPLIGDIPIGRLTSADIVRMIEDIAAGKSAADEKTGFRGRARITGGLEIANRTAAYLSSALAYAVKAHLLKANPAQSVQIKPTVQRQRYLSEDEFKRLGAALDKLEAEGANIYHIAAIRLAALTGLRAGEVLHLQWKQLDLAAGTARLTDTKTGPRAVVLSPAALAVLERLPRISGNPHVFPASIGAGPVTSVRKTLVRAADRAGIQGLTMHVLRHSFASVGINSGLTLAIVGGMLGHRRAATTARYAHLETSTIANATTTTSATVAGAMGITTTTNDET